MVSLLVALVFGGAVFLHQKRLVRLHETRWLMGTIVDLEVSFPDPEIGKKAMAAAWKEMERWEQVFSESRADSEIMLINRMAGSSPVRVSPEVLKVTRAALEFSRKSGGAFDPTWAALARDPRGWRINPDNPRVPLDEDLRRILPRVDYRKVEINEGESQIFLREAGMALGLGGIAKGYIVDRAVSVLRSGGARSGIVNAGGDLRVFGKPWAGPAWRIGVRDPLHPDRILARLSVSDGAVTTSGNYERAVVVNGVRYHHIFDPHTGMPSRGMAGVTLVAPEAITADALATAVFVLGMKKGEDLLRGFPGAEAILINEQGERLVTNGLKNRVEFLDR